MTLLDIVVVGIVGLSGLIAVLRGMVQETFSLGGWILAGVAAFFGLPYVKPFTRDLLPWPIVADIAAAAGIFIIVLVIATIISASLAERMKSSRFGTLDRSLGLLYGLARGYVLAALFYLLLIFIFSQKSLPDWIEEARTRPVLELGARFMVGLAPKNFLPDEIEKMGRPIPTGK